ncbi:hypothetical protein F7230_09290 [Corynebacterium sp. 320]|uniref:Uncharacterized protein n=1 Tax=Corynebacterium zhongnanshanii TaxID=2768834 RepID=A0ABQ6VH84_9CORY|nr:MULTISPECIES: hypothetical protein [Corynebacterium]KAB1501409.1 hypothetical protein F7230_09290 [Corynebacterium sp. 320]KAB3521009.1 hypothetical protein F8377_07260 [Corynebacterium zhongnanshanii]KAB3525767.1 hypothetical protein F8354_09290 [Corynebacterium sp. 250]MCR5914650.1 hypothetical protein [Corynebacterium sp. zg254]QNP92654.1 hypothetical protein IAU67_02275 [Corynebacterium zhongnanshanii]
MHSWPFFTVFAVSFVICAGLAAIRTPEEPGRSRIGFIVAIFWLFPALIILVLILRDGSRSAPLGELIAIAVYALIVSSAGTYALEKRKLRKQ